MIPRRLAGALSRLAAGDLVLLVRITGWTLVLPALKRLLSLPRLVRLVWAAPRGGGRDIEYERHVATLVRRLYASSLVPLDNNCLERSLLTYRLLGRLNARPELVTGVRRQGSAVAGHAWVMVDGEPVGDPPETLDDFSRVMTFGADGSLLT